MIFGFITFSGAQEQVLQGGELTGYKIWRGSVVIHGDVTIPPGSQLNIEPGAKIVFAANRDDQHGGTDKTRSELIVRGKLIVRGEADNKILFTSESNAPRMGDWYGLQFLHSQSGCIMEYAVVEYAYNGVTIKNTVFPLKNCEIRYNYNSGIRTEVKAGPQIIQNIISENGYAGLVCELGAVPVLTDNLISQNQMGVVVLSLSVPNLGSVAKDIYYNPGRNQFANNEEYDIYNHSTKSVSAQNNSWDSPKRPKLYDRQENKKYGSIIFDPKLNQASSGNLLLLAQSAAANPPSAVPATQNNRLDISTNQVTRNPTAAKQPNRDTVSKNTSLDTVLQKTLAVDLAISTQPLLASASDAVPDNTESPVDKKEIKHFIDYDQVFLEPFLDTHGKKVIRKEKLVITETMQKVLEPGEVRVKVIVAKNGSVESASGLRGINPILDNAILNTVRKYRYEPGMVNGKPVRFSTNELFRFK